MHFMPAGPTSWYNLPRDGGVAYAAQESWVQNETIRVRHRYLFKARSTQDSVGQYSIWISL